MQSSQTLLTASVCQAGLAWAVLPNLGWRWLLLLTSVPLLIPMLVYPVLPESPYYLAVSGQRERAAAVLRKVAEANYRSLPHGELAQSGVEQSDQIQVRDCISNLCGSSEQDSIVVYLLLARRKRAAD